MAGWFFFHPKCLFATVDRQEDDEDAEPSSEGFVPSSDVRIAYRGFCLWCAFLTWLVL